jgi:hypothetical protein
MKMKAEQQLLDLGRTGTHREQQIPSRYMTKVLGTAAKVEASLDRKRNQIRSKNKCEEQTRLQVVTSLHTSAPCFSSGCRPRP